MIGNIFNIQCYSIHDGPGIRTTVFLKGCPLNCLWCQNPESREPYPQLMYFSNLCTGCGECITVCPKGAIIPSEGKTATNRSLCANCGACVKHCGVKAREITGQVIDAREAADKACSDRIFFKNSDGGVTLSGGEALYQPEFAAEILRLCKEKGVHTAIETCGYANPEHLSAALRYTDLVLYDFKHINPDIHKKLTGVDNRLILDNAVRTVRELGKPLVGRVPIVPGYNDDPDNVAGIAMFIARELGRDVKVHLLPYNPLGESKNASLERSGYLTLKPQRDDALEALRSAMAAHLSNVVIGG